MVKIDHEKDVGYGGTGHCQAVLDIIDPAELTVLDIIDPAELKDF